MAKRRSQLNIVTAGDLAAAIACAKLEALEKCGSDDQKQGVLLMEVRVRSWIEEMGNVKLPSNIAARRQEPRND